MTIATKATIWRMVILTLICSVFLSRFIRHEQEALEQNIANQRQSAIILSQITISNMQKNYNSRIKRFLDYKSSTTKDDILHAFKKRDRKLLLQLCQPFFTLLKKENPNFQTMNWVSPDNRAFLRVHRPAKFGDEITELRPDVTLANTTRQPISGFMTGIVSPQYRVIEPVFYHGEYLGILQFGINVRTILEDIHHHLELDLALAINKNQFKRLKVDKLKTLDYGKYILFNSNLSLYRQARTLDLEQDNQQHKINGRYYCFFSGENLLDYQQKPVGQLIAALDITNTVKNTRALIVLTLLISISTLFASWLVLRISFKKLLGQIGRLNQDLTAANKELRWAKEAVDEKVRKQTTELIQINSQLEEEIHQRNLVTEKQEELACQLRHSQKLEAIGTMAGGIAHEFNNMLTAIIGNAELGKLQLSPANDQATITSLNEILRAGGRARDLVQQILTFSRHREEHKIPLQLGLLIKENIKFLRSSTPAAIRIHSELTACDSYVQADPSQIHQLLMNLCSNAIEAIGESKGEIRISLSNYTLSQGEKDFLTLEPGYYVKIIVQDNGPGMDPQTMERIFDPFFTTKTIGEGSGMGLAVIHGIIENMTGGIRADSSPGMGTTFEVILPRLKTELGQDLDQNNISSGSERILLVDDEDELAHLGKMLLSTLGYQVKAMTDPQEALTFFRQNPDDFNLVITDQSMPEMSGLEMAEEMLKIRADIPVLICTGYSKELTEEKIRGSMVKGMIMKPFSLHEVSRIIRQTLDQ